MPENIRVERSLAVCIATWRRPRQLEKLLADLARQTLLPDTIAVIDGDPSSGKVETILRSATPTPGNTIVYLPSNHASLPYQRYLGWRLCASSRCLVYLDDDLRIPRPDFLEKIVAPLEWRELRVSGVTCPIQFGDPRQLGSSNFQSMVLELTRSGPPAWHRLMNRGGIAKGGLSPSGHRRMPRDTGAGYEPVEWLSGAVMAFRTEALDESCFPESGFALFEARLGTGEDLVLARHVRERGALMFAYCTEVDHPYEVSTNFGPSGHFRLGVTYAYGERYVNDHHRGSAGPSLSDRIGLARSLFGTLILNWCRAAHTLRWRRAKYACGFTLGTIRALLLFPTAASLCPAVDWKRDAESALGRTRAFGYQATASR